MFKDSSSPASSSRTSDAGLHTRLDLSCVRSMNMSSTLIAFITVDQYTQEAEGHNETSTSRGHWGRTFYKWNGTEAKMQPEQFNSHLFLAWHLVSQRPVCKTVLFITEETQTNNIGKMWHNQSFVFALPKAKCMELASTTLMFLSHGVRW